MLEIADGLGLRWNHVTRLSCVTLALIIKLHSKSLQQLEVLGPFDLTIDLRIESLPQLRILELSDVDIGANPAATRLLARSRLTLNRIKLGHETSNALAWLYPDLHHHPNRASLMQDFWKHLRGLSIHFHGLREIIEPEEEATVSVTMGEAMKSSSKQIQVILPAVDMLHLIAIDAAIRLFVVNKLLSKKTHMIYSLNQPFIDIGKLRSLILESCNMPSWIDSLSACAQRLKGTLRLEVFVLREEQIESTFPRKLDTFFGLFRGLKRVSLLLQGENTTLPANNLISHHGESLKSLIIDQRRCARSSFGLCTNFRDGPKRDTLLHLIRKGCPELEQLGLSDFGSSNDWRDYDIAQLKNLRSLSLRVLPRQKNDVTNLQDCERAHERFARHFVRLYLESMPNLTIIGTGSLTFKDIRLGRMSSDDNTDLEHYLSPRYFYVDRFTNIKGEQRSILTKIAQGTPTGIDEHSSHIDIFQPYWID